MSAAIDAGADMVGLVFFDKSPRYVTKDQAIALVADVPAHIQRVGLFVDPSNDQLGQILAHVPLDVIQLHAPSDPRRILEVQSLSQKPVYTALGLSTQADLTAADPFIAVSDGLLLDAKPPKNAVIPGGNGLAFDWTLLQGFTCSKPWLLAGGLTPENVADAIEMTGAPGVDVSSGVENAPGQKDADKIAAFVRAARGT